MQQALPAEQGKVRSFMFGMPSQEFADQFYSAFDNHDSFTVSCLENSIETSSGTPPHVDPQVFAATSRDYGILHSDHSFRPPEDMELESKHLLHIKEHLDDPFESLGDDTLPGLKRISVFLADYIAEPGNQYKPFKEEQLFLVRSEDEEEYERVMAGHKYTANVRYSQVRKDIITPRHLATIVGDDDPFLQASFIVKQLLNAGVPLRDFLNDHTGKRFALGGYVQIMGMIGELAKRLGWVSFNAKWEVGMARALQLMPELGQVAPYGHPGHPSTPAMHAMIYRAIMMLLKMLFDVTHPWYDSTVGDELELWAANMGDGRSGRLVHWPHDNHIGAKCCYWLAIRVLKENLPSEYRRALDQQIAELRQQNDIRV